MLSAIAASSLSLSVGGVGKKVFIDGEAGTTGLQVRDRLAKRGDLELLSLADDQRKDAGARAAAINAADAVILCLPDDAAIEAAALVEPSDLSRMLAGEPHIDIADWEANTAVTGGMRRTAKLFGWFWRAVRSFTAAEREQLLQFVTGSRRPPLPARETPASTKQPNG